MSDNTKDTKPTQAEVIAKLQEENGSLKAEVIKLREDVDSLLKAGSVEAAKAEKPKTPKDTFQLNGKKYRFTQAKMIVPRVGALTALEALTDKTKHEALGKKTVKEFLVDNSSSLVEEVE